MSSKNPSVNRYLDDKHLDNIDHALGRPVFPLRETYRNYFATNADSALAADFDASPYWHLSGVSGKMAYFSVTTAGRHALVGHLATLSSPWQAFVVTFDGISSIVPERSRSKAKYACYRSISDVDPDLTFSEFAKGSQVRRAA